MSTYVVDAIIGGTWDDELVAVIDKALRAGVRIQHIPPPSGHSAWQDEDRQELLGEFLASDRGIARMVQLATRATTDQHFYRLLNQAVAWFLTDRAREDPRPKLQRSLRKIMATMPDVVSEGSRACLRAHQGNPVWVGGEDVLLAAAKAVDVAPPPWGLLTKREGPPTDYASFKRVCEAVLDAAQGPLEFGILTRTVAERLQVRRRWDEELPEGFDSMAPLHDGSRYPSGLGYTLGREIWAGLDEDERLLLPFLDAGGRTASRECGISLGKSAAQEMVDTLREKLALMLEGCDEQLDVMTTLIGLHDAWNTKRTRGDGRS